MDKTLTETLTWTDGPDTSSYNQVATVGRFTATVVTLGQGRFNFWIIGPSGRKENALILRDTDGPTARKMAERLLYAAARATPTRHYR